MYIRLIEGEGRVVYRSMGQIHDAICEVVGPLQRSPIETSVNQAPAPSLAAAAAAAAAAANARSSDQGCRDGTVRRRCLALRDYYPFWRQSLEEAAAGKLLPVDLSENPKVGWCSSTLRVLLHFSTHRIYHDLDYLNRREERDLNLPI